MIRVARVALATMRITPFLQQSKLWFDFCTTISLRQKVIQSDFESLRFIDEKEAEEKNFEIEAYKEYLAFFLMQIGLRTDRRRSQSIVAFLNLQVRSTNNDFKSQKIARRIAISDFFSSKIEEYSEIIRNPDCKDRAYYWRILLNCESPSSSYFDESFILQQTDCSLACYMRLLNEESRPTDHLFPHLRKLLQKSPEAIFILRQLLDINQYLHQDRFTLQSRDLFIQYIPKMNKLELHSIIKILFEKTASIFIPFIKAICSYLFNPHSTYHFGESYAKISAIACLRRFPLKLKDDSVIHYDPSEPKFNYACRQSLLFDVHRHHEDKFKINQIIRALLPKMRTIPSSLQIRRFFNKCLYCKKSIWQDVAQLINAYAFQVLKDQNLDIQTKMEVLQFACSHVETIGSKDKELLLDILIDELEKNCYVNPNNSNEILVKSNPHFVIIQLSYLCRIQQTSRIEIPNIWAFDDYLQYKDLMDEKVIEAYVRLVTKLPGQDGAKRKSLESMEPYIFRLLDGDRLRLGALMNLLVALSSVNYHRKQICCATERSLTRVMNKKAMKFNDWQLRDSDVKKLHQEVVAKGYGSKNFKYFIQNCKQAPEMGNLHIKNYFKLSEQEFQRVRSRRGV